VRDDCIRLLGGHTAAEGVNIDRQCDRVGICEHWPGVDTGPSVLTTPWAVDPLDNIQKYYALAGLTFVDSTTVDQKAVIARRMGRVRADVAPDATRPRAVMDAGIIHFVPGSRVAREIVAYHEFGDEKFCISPVLLNGAGGGFYAVGVNCCTKDTFTCGDQDGLSAVVVNSNLGDFAQARLILEANKGVMYHGDGKGVETDAPIFVSWSTAPEGEQNNPSGDLAYVLPTNTTFCVAPITPASSDLSQKLGFFAVGEDCCDDTSFACGDVADAAAKSGSLVQDLTGDYITAVKQLEFRDTLKIEPRPIFLSWTAEVLVTKP
jgi:hypothetical protein